MHENDYCVAFYFRLGFLFQLKRFETRDSNQLPSESNDDITLGLDAFFIGKWMTIKKERNNREPS